LEVTDNVIRAKGGKGQLPTCLFLNGGALVLENLKARAARPAGLDLPVGAFGLRACDMGCSQRRSPCARQCAQRGAPCRNFGHVISSLCLPKGPVSSTRQADTEEGNAAQPNLYTKFNMYRFFVHKISITPHGRMHKATQDQGHSDNAAK
jgi:hypothetical protein